MSLLCLSIQNLSLFLTTRSFLIQGTWKLTKLMLSLWETLILSCFSPSLKYSSSVPSLKVYSFCSSTTKSAYSFVGTTLFSPPALKYCLKETLLTSHLSLWIRWGLLSLLNLLISFPLWLVCAFLDFFLLLLFASMGFVTKVTINNLDTFYTASIVRIQPFSS